MNPRELRRVGCYKRGLVTERLAGDQEVVTAAIAPNSHYAAAVSSEPPRRGRADVGRSGRAVTVLVADDNDVSLRLCRRVLEKAGHKVLTASDGLEAVTLALANSPDMILLDDAMPGLNSPWATRQIKKQRPGIAIVVASVDPGASNRERYLAAGADDMLIKPIRLSDLLAVVARLTANRGQGLTGAGLDSYESVERHRGGGIAGARFFARLFGFVRATRGPITKVQRQKLLKEQTLDLVLQALDARDPYTGSHSIRVADLAGRLGGHLRLGHRDVELLRIAGSLHDLGMIGIPDNVLKKAGRLNDEEWEVMRRHPDIGADMLAQHASLAEVAPIVRHHHEHWDGSGYPTGLKGDVIPLGARIVSVADEFDTITRARFDLKTPITPIEAVEDISRRANRWFDPNVVDALRVMQGLGPLEVGRPR